MALALGRTVRELESSMDSRELSEWLAYHMIEPIPDANWHAGLLASTMCNLWSKAKTRPEDFIPRVKVARGKSDLELLAKFQALAAGINARQK